MRTERGPRQRVVATLGKLAEDDLQAGWDDIEALLEGRPPTPRTPELFDGKPGSDTKPGLWELADLSRIEVGRVREFGSVFLGLALWRRLGLQELLESLIEPGREEVAWADVAAVLTVGKFCGQASELGIAESWYARTALEDIAGIPAEAVNDDRLYRALDKVGAHKDRLCEHLMERYRSWFGVDFEFLLYDVTSAYFEGLAEGNEKAARGYSRDHRGDCKQVCIGLVCTPEGLPLNFEVFAGNRTDVTTVGDMVRKMEERFGKALYLVGTPKSHLRAYEAELAEKENWVEVQHGVEARLVAHPDGREQERFVLCRSTARGAKERAMLERQMSGLTEELVKIDASLRRGPPPPKVERWSGALGGGWASTRQQRGGWRRSWCGMRKDVRSHWN